MVRVGLEIARVIHRTALFYNINVPLMRQSSDFAAYFKMIFEVYIDYANERYLQNG